MEQVFVKVNENTIGPLSEKKIKSLIEQGVFTLNDLVWSKKSDKWVPIAAYNELHKFFKSI